MQHPFQCVETFPSPLVVQKEGQNVTRRVLFAACAHELVTLELESGQVLSKWSSTQSPSPAKDLEDKPDEPPGKKRKVEAKAESGPNIIKVVAARDLKHVVVVTGEDKCARVFEMLGDGSLNQLSERCMPKRPCAISISEDGNTIFCGDKFGDVYALPLIYDSAEFVASSSADGPKKAFVPSASEKTVHSVRNLRALADQRKQALTATAKEPLQFPHELLLGHVSMLTDLAVASIDDVDHGRTLHYVITSDRDEHIRVSRGPPQSHIIENFCMGHREFVSKLALSSPEILISGGGDDFLLVWDWRRGLQLAKIELRGLASSFVQEGGQDIAVSGLWALHDDVRKNHVVVVMVEKVPAIFTFVLREDGQSLNLVKSNAHELHAAPVDGVLVEHKMIVSLDTFQESPTLETSNSKRLVGLTLGASYDSADGSPDQTEVWHRSPVLDGQLDLVNSLESKSTTRGNLDGLLYAYGNLRKRGGGTEED